MLIIDCIDYIDFIAYARTLFSIETPLGQGANDCSKSEDMKVASCRGGGSHVRFFVRRRKKRRKEGRKEGGGRCFHESRSHKLTVATESNVMASAWRVKIPHHTNHIVPWEDCWVYLQQSVGKKWGIFGWGGE